jgi:serine/threonine protein kinase
LFFFVCSLSLSLSLFFVISLPLLNSYVYMYLYYSSLRHPNIVQYLGTCSEKLCIVLEYLPLGTVMDFLLSSHQALGTEMLLGLASDSAEGLRYMHDRGFIHRDLKSENLLLVSTDPAADVLCKLADFGESRHISATMSRRHIGTPRWTSPEVFAGQPYNEKADCFSYGMLLWELCHREIPFSEVRRDSEVEDLIVAGGRPAIHERGKEKKNSGGIHVIYASVGGVVVTVRDCLEVHLNTQKQPFLVTHSIQPFLLSVCLVPTGLRLLIQSCWNQNPANRPPFDDVLFVLDDLLRRYSQQPATRDDLPPGLQLQPPSTLVEMGSINEQHGHAQMFASPSTSSLEDNLSDSSSNSSSACSGITAPLPLTVESPISSLSSPSLLRQPPPHQQRRPHQLAQQPAQQHQRHQQHQQQQPQQKRSLSLRRNKSDLTARISDPASPSSCSPSSFSCSSSISPSTSLSTSFSPYASPSPLYSSPSTPSSAYARSMAGAQSSSSCECSPAPSPSISPAPTRDLGSAGRGLNPRNRDSTGRASLSPRTHRPSDSESLAVALDDIVGTLDGFQ